LEIEMSKTAAEIPIGSFYMQWGVDNANGDRPVSVTTSTGTFTTGDFPDEVTWIGTPNPNPYWSADEVIRITPWVPPATVTPTEIPFGTSQGILDALRRGGFASLMPEMLTLPEDLEVVSEARLVITEDGEREFFCTIKGPKIAKGMTEAMPPELLKRLDYEMKLAMVRAFRLTTENPTKRTVILEEE